MNYALTDSNGLIVNRIVLEDPEGWTTPDGHTLHAETDTPFDIGGTIIDGVYTPLPQTPTPVFIPTYASKLGLKRALSELGIWDSVKASIAADPFMQEEWDFAIEIRRTDPLVQSMISMLNLTSTQVDALLIRANELVS